MERPKPEITPKNILHFLEGHFKWLGDEFKILPRHMKEQVIYRTQFCKDDCIPAGFCRYCGCDLPGKFYVSESCNGEERFPDMMNSEDWQNYKIENNIKIGK